MVVCTLWLYIALLVHYCCTLHWLHIMDVHYAGLLTTFTLIVRTFPSENISPVATVCRKFAAKLQTFRFTMQMRSAANSCSKALANSLATALAKSLAKLWQTFWLSSGKLLAKLQQAFWQSCGKLIWQSLWQTLLQRSGKPFGKALATLPQFCGKRSDLRCK